MTILAFLLQLHRRIVRAHRIVGGFVTSFKPRPFLLAVLFALLAGFLTTTSGYAALGFVGNMFPRPGNGSPTTITQGSPYTVYVQVWKNGTTNFPGQGANIQCFLYWGQVSTFGGTWTNIQTTPMVYNVEVGNNDEYKATINPNAGLYEHTAYCVDTTDNHQLWQGDGNGRLTVNPSTVSITGARAIWLNEDTIAWNGVAGSSYRLFYDPDGAINLGTASYLNLTATGTVSGSTQFPNANGRTALKIAPANFGLIPTILKGDMVVASYNGGGTLVDATRMQLSGVVDDLYTYTGDLGVTYSSGVPTLRVWAPTAKSVTLRLFADATTGTFTTSPMTLNSSTGVWSVTGTSGWDKQYYLYDVEVYVPSLDAVTHNIVTDPYSLNLSQNSTRSQIVNIYDFSDPTLVPTGWTSFTKPTIAAPEDITVYELHLRDFSINDASVTNPAHRGTYKAFTYDGTGPNPNTTLSNGMNHLLQLQQAGLTHVHLLPAFDIASTNEDASLREEPNAGILNGAARDSDDQQAEVADHRATDGFNWGYDPFHYGAPEGSYATAQNDTTRIKEFREMVQTLNQNGLMVVMDVVYNHTAASGQDTASVLDKIVPGYYYRMDNDGNIRNSSCCSDTGAEFTMMEKLIVDTVVLWAKAYKVDSFRFDLMNLHPKSVAVNVDNAVHALTIPADGVDGSQIYVYGEGWDFGSAKEKGLDFAGQFAMAGTGIGTFNDRLRDASHGGYNSDSTQIRHQGFINGLSYDWNGYFYSNRELGDLRYETDRLKIGLAGSLQNYVIIDQNNATVSGIGLNGTGYTLDPQETINYVSKHDNETLYDQGVFKLPSGTTMAERVRSQNMGVSITGLAQGIPFFDLGLDMLRSKSLDRNSYDSGDWFNRVDFTYSDNNFGSGLPPAWDNSTRWGIMQPLLANTALDPATSDILNAGKHFREILRIRKSSALFRLRTASDVQSRVQFYNQGSGQQNAFIVMGLSDANGTDLDPNYEYILVLFNANKVQQTFTNASFAGLNFSLHPLQADATDADSVVQSSSFNNGTGAFTIPARTTAVFVSTQAPVAPSAIGYVGSMFPVGGNSTPFTVGATTNLNVYVQVYKDGVTPGGGQGAGIQCYLHWGKYGTTWTDTPMTYNVDIGNNDEYRATINTGPLTVGTYGYTAYCTDNGGISRKWRDSPFGNNNGDGGDGVISILPLPANDPSPAPAGGTFVHLFEWKWTDIQKECPYLAQKGYTAVQVSPPMEHVLPSVNPVYPWWVRYQPVGYSLTNSRSGTLTEFQNMVNACAAVDVDIYADAVINHMSGMDPDSASATGTNGTVYQHYNYPGLFDSGDFHYCGTTGSGAGAAHNINSYGSRYQVQSCELVNLADLNTGDTAVQASIRGYLQSMLNLGVKGFRIDAAKHIFAYDLQQIMTGLSPQPYIFQEAIEGGGEPVKAYEYAYIGDVTEFNYSQTLGSTFNCGTIANLNTTIGNGWLNSAFAQVFVDNHDNQRGHGAGGACIVDHRDGQVYNLASIFMLAHPYGHPSVMSSYYWDQGGSGEDNEGPPSTTSPNTSGSGAVTLPVYDGTEPLGAAPNRCDIDNDGESDGDHWVCEHRRTAIANMVLFRKVTDGESLTNWWSNGNNRIAFGRDDKGFVAINREGSAFSNTYQTNMPAGTYCDITKGDLQPNGTCTGPTITVNGSGQIVSQNLNAMDAFAIHIAARTDWDYGDLAPSYGIPYHTTNAPLLGTAWQNDDGVEQGVWTPINGVVAIEVNGAAGFVSGWVDWNKDGDFTDANERVLTNESFTSGQTRTLIFPAAVDPSNQTFNLRFRVYSTAQTLAPPSPTDGAAGGEVEDYTFSFGALSVSLAEFGAEAQAEHIRVYWTTASEVETLGFNLYRATTDDFASATRINDELIPAQGTGGSQGASYDVVDRDVRTGNSYFYWLEDVETTGTTALNGPVSATATTPTAVHLSTWGVVEQPVPLVPIAMITFMLIGAAGFVLRFRSSL